MKQKAKKPLSILLSLCMLLSITAGMSISAYAASYSDDEIREYLAQHELGVNDDDDWEYVDGDEFKYRLYSDGTAGITGYNGSSKNVEIPSQIDGHKVTVLLWLNSYANNNIKNIESVKLPDTIKKIGGGAFDGCYNLSKINIPKSVIKIDAQAFYDTAYSNVDEDAIYIDDVLVAVKNYAESVNVKSGTRLIADNAFLSCRYLSEVSIPNTVKTIGSSAFYDCGVEKINIPESVIYIGNNAFAESYDLKAINVDSNNKYYASNDGVLYDKSISSLLFYPSGKTDKSFVTPSTVKIIGSDSICNTPIQYLIVSDSVEILEENSVRNNYKLKSVKLGKNVKTIGWFAFYYCYKVNSITLSNSVTSIDEGAFGECRSLTDVYYSGSKDEWNNIQIENYYNENDCLLKATIHYNSEGEPLSGSIFADLKGYESYDDYITYTSINNSFIKGTNPPAYTEFSPTTAITRAMFVTILYRMAGAPYDEANPHTTTPFTDITNTGVYYYNAACWALDNGITTQKTFKPNDLVVREQTASFLFRYASNEGFVDDSYKSVDLSKYSDLSSVSSWAVPAMQWANQQGMITGTQQGTLNPKGSTLRIHATKILYGFGMACGIGNM